MESLCTHYYTFNLAAEITTVHVLLFSIRGIAETKKKPEKPYDSEVSSFLRAFPALSQTQITVQSEVKCLIRFVTIYAEVFILYMYTRFGVYKANCAFTLSLQNMAAYRFVRRVVSFVFEIFRSKISKQVYMTSKEERFNLLPNSFHEPSSLISQNDLYLI